MTPSATDLHAPTGTPGLDDILAGGLPAGKPTILTGPPGSGKTLFSLAFACQALNAGEAAVYASFEERTDMLARHAAFLGYDLDGAVASGRFKVLDMRPGLEEATTDDDVDLSPVRARIEHAVAEAGATRLVLDSIDSLFLIFGDRRSTRRELFHLLHWIADNRITTITTSVQRSGEITSHLGLVPHVTDCVLELDQSLQNNVMTRHLRVVKYRGSTHGTNVYPFIIDQEGIFVLPITSTRLTSAVRGRSFSTGVELLDEMLDGHGIKSGSVLQISGRTGTGKTILAARIVRSACDAGLNVLYVSFEEATDPLVENLKSVGNDLSGYLSQENDDVGTLYFEPVRAVELSLEGHLVHLIRLVETRQPDVLILDPVTSLREQGTLSETKSAVVRLVNHMKERGKTVLFTELLPDDAGDHSSMNISSIVDTWIRLRQIETNGEFSRLIHVAKSRGINASNQVREFQIRPDGLGIEMPYVGPGEMVVGTAKKMRERDEARQKLHAERHLDTLRRQLSIRERMARLQRELDETEHRSKLEDLQREIEALENQLASQSENREFTRQERLGDRDPHESQA